MRILYIDCRLGGRVDAIASALMDMCPDTQAVFSELNGIWPDKISYSMEQAPVGIRLRLHEMEEDAGQEGSQVLSEQDISKRIENEICSEKVRQDICRITELLSQIPLRMSDLAMIAVVCRLMERIEPDQVLASTVELGKGYISDASGLWLIPTSDVLSICRDMPIKAELTEGEACDPAGAAVLRYFVDHYSDDLPGICIDRQGSGWSQSYEGHLYIRSFLGRRDKPNSDRHVVLIHANLDDMTGEAIGYAQEKLWDAGAVDVYTTAIMMKKNRPAIMLSCICRPEKKDACVEAYMRYTTTLGVRIERMDREILERSFETRRTRAGDIRVKTARFKNIKKWKAEYEDLRSIAQREGISLREAERYLRDDR